MRSSFSVEAKISPFQTFILMDGLSGRLGALHFINRYNQTARPFNWKYTAADLARLLDRISAHKEPASLPQAA